MKTKAMDPAKWLRTATSTTKLTLFHLILPLARRSFDGIFCLAYNRDVQPKWHPPDSDGVVNCGTKYPLETTDASQCPPSETGLKFCCSNDLRGWKDAFGVSEFIGGTCGSSEEHCSCEENPADCTDYRIEANQAELSNIPLTVAKCDDVNDHNGGPLYFDMPNQKNVLERLSSWCNDENNCMWAENKTMHALYDVGDTYYFGNKDRRWR